MKLIKRIKKFSDDIPQNFEFTEEKTNFEDQSDFSNIDTLSEVQSSCSYGPRKKGRPRKIDPSMADRRDIKRVRKEISTSINFDEYANKPNLVSRLTQA